MFRKTDESAQHKLARIPQWGHPCDKWRKPDFVDRSAVAVGEQRQLCHFQQQRQQSFKTVWKPHDNYAHLWFEIREVWTVWSSIQLTEKNQNIILSWSCAWWCAAGVQKQQQPKPKVSGRNSDGVPQKVPETPANGYSETQIWTATLQSGEPENKWFFKWTPEISKKAFDVAAQANIAVFVDANMPPNLQQCNNQAYLENTSVEQIVSHLKREIELISLEAPVELQMNTVTLHTTKPSLEKHKPTFHHCKQSGLNQSQCRELREKENKKNNKKSAGINNSFNNNIGETNANPNNSK